MNHDDCAGREYHRKAPTQRAIVALLKNSPLPWTSGMIRDWFALKSMGGPFWQAIQNNRIRRIGRGLYSCPCKTPQTRTPITDEWITKLTGISL